MSKNLVSMNNLQSILEPIGKNIVNKINNKDISQEQKEKLNKVNIIDTTTNSNNFLSNKGMYHNINIDNLNENINKTNNVYNIFKIEEKHDKIEEIASKQLIPTPIYASTSCIYKNKIYRIGGAYINTVQIYDIENDTWTIGNPMPTARGYLISSVYDRKIYCIGGYRSVLDTVEIYDIENDTWATGNPMPTPRYGLTGQIYKDKIYCIGGYDNTNYLNSVEIYNISSNTWNISKSTPTSRYASTCCIYKDKVYYIGGEIGDKRYTNDVEIYDIKTDIWTNGKPMPTNREHLGSSVHENKIYCIGGHNSTYLNNVEIYNIENDIWTVGNPMHNNISYINANLYNHKIYYTGHGTNSNILQILSLPYIEYDITLPSSIQNKLDCIASTGDGTKILSDKGEYIDIPKGYRFMESNEVTDFIEKIKESLNS